MPSRRSANSNVSPTASVAEVRITVSSLSKSFSSQDGRDVDGRGLQEAAAAAALYPVDVGTVGALAPKLQALLQFLDAAEQRDHFLGRVLHQLQVRADQFQGAHQVFAAPRHAARRTPRGP